jgi:hypothetical protein
VRAKNSLSDAKCYRIWACCNESNETQGLGFLLEREFDAQVMVRYRVNQSNSIIVVLDVPELPADAERIVKRSVPIC